jgi:hypothetical protein
MEDVKIVASVEQSTMASTWTEHLCLHRTSEGKWCLDIRGFEVIGEASEFEDDEGELPEEIDGQEVVGTEDGFIIINNLVLHSDAYPAYEFYKFDETKFEEMFRPENAEWCGEETKIKIQEVTAKSE